MPVVLQVNGITRHLDAAPDAPLLYVLRNDCGIHSAKFGCGLAQCGACTVLIGGRPVRSCTMPAGAATGAILTLESHASDPFLGALRRAFIAEQAAQCGYCISGMIMSAKALLDRIPDPGEEQIRAALNGNLCRCGTHTRIVRAIGRAARERAA